MSSETAVANKTAVKTVADAVLDGLRELPPEEQAQVLEFIEALRQKQQQESAATSRSQHPLLKGRWTDLGVHITEEDIAEARREMWGNFPREDII